jgi:hypothetical protein
MQAQDFLKQLNSYPESDLEFHLGPQKINQNYHITEVLYSLVTSIDCGGQEDH